MAFGLMQVLIIVLAAALIVAVPIVIGVYVARDAGVRGMPKVAWALAAALLPGFVGLIVYLLVRGEKEGMRCPACGSPAKLGYEHCPRCGEKLEAMPPAAPDRGLGKVVALAVGIPAAVFAVLALAVMMFSASPGIVLETQLLPDAAAAAEAREDVGEWIEECRAQGDGLYLLRHTAPSPDGTEETQLIAFCIGFRQMTPQVVSKGIFGRALLKFVVEPAAEEETLTLCKVAARRGLKPDFGDVDVTVTDSDQPLTPTALGVGMELTLNVAIEGTKDVYSLEYTLWNDGEVVTGGGAQNADGSALTEGIEMTEYLPFVDRCTVTACGKDRSPLADIMVDVPEDGVVTLTLKEDGNGNLIFSE